MSGLQVVGIVPARGGSKGLARKNLALLAGRSLLAYTADAAHASRTLTRVLVSTDDDEIAAAAEELDLEVQSRPSGLAGDATPMIDVVQHVIATLGAEAAGTPEIVVLLQPTSPLRRAAHIDEAVDLLIGTGADAVVSVVHVPHNLTPDSLMAIEGGRLLPLAVGAGPSTRQDKRTLYARNGPAVLVARVASLGRYGFYGGDIRPLVMDRADSIDIDDATDMQMAEFWLARR